jgi:hypothetical protein
MVDTPTDPYGFRQQERGTNVSSWGDDKLNEVLRAIAQTIGTIKQISISADYSVTSTYYLTSADNKNAGFDFIGTLLAPANITVDAKKTRYVVFNNTTGGFPLTVKTATGAGVVIPNGRCAAVYCDGIDVKSAVATTGGTTTPTTGSADIPAWAAVEAAIAAASGLTAPFILISGTDTTPGYAGTKITAGGLLKQNINSPAGNAVIEFDATGYVASGTNAYVIAAGATSKAAFKTTYLVTFTNANTAAATLDDGSGAVAIRKNGAVALGPNDIPAGSTKLVTFDGTYFQVPVAPPPINLAMAAAMVAA